MKNTGSGVSLCNTYMTPVWVTGIGQCTQKSYYSSVFLCFAWDSHEFDTQNSQGQRLHYGLLFYFQEKNQPCRYQLLYKQCNFLVFLKPFTRKSTFLSLKCSTLEKYKNIALVKCLKTLSFIDNIQSFILYIITRVSQSSCQLLLKEGLKFNPL